MLYKIEKLLSFGIQGGNRITRSTPFLNFFYLGTSKLFVIYNIKRIFFSLLGLKAFLVIGTKQVSYYFILVFSNYAQCAIALKQQISVETHIKFKHDPQVKIRIVLSPSVGFLTNKMLPYLNAQKLILEDDEILFNNLPPLTYLSSKTIVVSFGNDVLPFVVKESRKKKLLRWVL
jgi:hypothetical protein